MSVTIGKIGLRLFSHIQHLEIIWPQTEDVADRTSLEAVRDLPFQYDLENIEVEQKTFTAISNIHSHYTNRAEGMTLK